MKKTFHSSTDDQQDTENAKQTTVVAISVGRLSYRKLNLSLNLCSCKGSTVGGCVLLLCVSAVLVQVVYKQYCGDKSRKTTGLYHQK